MADENLSRIDAYNLAAVPKLSRQAHARILEEGTRAVQEELRLKVDGWCGPKTIAAVEGLEGAQSGEAPSTGSSGLVPVPKGRSGIRSVYGAFEYEESTTQRGAIVIDKAWSRKNIVGVYLHTGKRVWLHRLVADEFRRLFEKACAASGYTPERIGTWVARHILWNPEKALSTHSWGIAVDFDSRLNRYGVPVLETKLGQHPAFVEVFEDAGWVWGGRWGDPDTGRGCDAMHFQRARV